MVLKETVTLAKVGGDGGRNMMIFLIKISL